MMKTNFTYTNVSNPRWANTERTRINCDVTWGEDHPYITGETHPFTAAPDDMFAEHTAKIWGDCINGKWGHIGDYLLLED